MRVLENPCLEDEVFAFGSNLGGRHGLGAALWARKYKGAIYGQGVGRQGMSYAIPTKDANLRVLSLIDIWTYVQDFVDYAKEHPELKFYVTRIGTGLAGYRISDIKPMFEDAPDNCRFDW